MLVPFFFKLREGGVPVSITEFLTLLEALQAHLAQSSAEDFYFLSRACLVKDERHFDRFDRAFAAHFKGAEQLFEALLAHIPQEWLQRMGERTLSEEEKGQADRDAEEAARRAEGTAPGRQQVDRHGRHVAVRRLRLQPRRYPHRPGRIPQPARGEGVGPTRVPQPR
jgi:uncharacterized protein with von Willebrand factor type A (vWA) domain